MSPYPTYITLPLKPPHDSHHLACTKEEREATKVGDAKRTCAVKSFELRLMVPEISAADIVVPCQSICY